MALLVSPEAFGARVNLDLDPNGQDDRLPNITLLLEQAQDAVLDYLKVLPDPMWTDSTVPPRVSSAIMLVAQALLDDSKSAEMLSGLGTSDPKNPVVALLIRLRDPAFA
jgi:hypothetical protein